MESCDAVDKELDKVIQKFTDIKGESMETINEAISVFSVLLSTIGNKQRNGMTSSSARRKYFCFMF